MGKTGVFMPNAIVMFSGGQDSTTCLYWAKKEFGDDIQAGTYRSSKTVGSCYWQRLSGFSGEFEDIIVNELTDAVSVVEIASTD